MYLTKLCLFYFIVLCNIYTVSSRCQPNKEKDCKDCSVGYIGFNCSIPCRYPGYGLSCQKVCNCSEEYCDISTGCKERKVHLPVQKGLNTVVENRMYPAREMIDLKHGEDPQSIPKQRTHPAKNTIQSEKPKESESVSQTTPILIGAVVALSLILLATGLKFSWKKAKHSCLRNRREDTGMPNIEVELNRITCDYEDMKENSYEDLDEKETCEDKDKKPEGNAENDYVDTLKISKMGGNKNEDRESKHFYDALK